MSAEVIINTDRFLDLYGRMDDVDYAVIGIEHLDLFGALLRQA